MISNVTEVKITGIADPTALGLFGFSVVTLLAASQKLGLTAGTPYIIPWAVFVGGIMQVIGGVLDFKKGSVFGGTAFTSYGFFWIAVGFTWLINMGVFGEQMFLAIDSNQFGVAIIAFLIISIFFTIGSMEMNKTLFVAFLAVDVLLLALALSTFGILPDFFGTLAGWAELTASIFAFWTGGASLLANHFGKPVLPTGKPFGIFK